MPTVSRKRAKAMGIAPTKLLNGERVQRIVLQLPWPPTANNAYFNNSRGGRSKSEAAKAYMQAVQALVTNTVGHVEGRLSVTIYCCAPDLRRYDVDNRSKVILDSLTQAGIWDDDAQVDALHLYRRAPKPDGGVSVCIVEMP